MKRQATIQQITWFLDLNRTSQLNLSPPYQRKSVWTLKDRRFFLDTIFRNYPCPPLFLHKTITNDGFTEYHVVDGKQRLETVLLFAQDKIALDKDFGDVTLDGKKFSELTTEQKRVFWDYFFTCEFLDITNLEDVNMVFDRVNRNARNLKPQELRHAKYSGWFITKAETEAELPFWEALKITTKARRKRMDNVQFVSELLLIIIEKSIVGFSQDYLDDCTAKYEDYDDETTDIDTDEFEEKLNIIKDYLIKIEKYNNCITTYADTKAIFYTLWALLYFQIDSLPDDYTTFAEDFTNFMINVNKIKSDTVSSTESNLSTDEQLFADNLRGASTDLPQRIHRLKALTNALIG